jgi:tRNA A-37 threonylcarbamoyl transferase component Bud32
MIDDSDSRTTLLQATGSGRRTSSWTLPPDLLAQAVQRLRSAALLFFVAFFLSAWFPALLSAEGRRWLFSASSVWLTGALTMGATLFLIWFLYRPTIPTRAKLWAGIAFEIFGSFGVATQQYHSVIAPIVRGGHARGAAMGLSWVAGFVLMFSVIVPMRPRIALWSAIVSVSSVPLVYATGVALGTNVPLSPSTFFFSLIFPYMIVVFLAYFGARVVYGLGTAVRKARELGSYRLVERLGEGGMGEVWRAQHRMLARPAAIKLIRPQVLGLRDHDSQGLVIKRFEREAQATALMRSPHTMELYDFGVADDGTFYYVMELLNGFDLDLLVRKFGPVPPARAVHFLQQICSSLAEAHESNLIHRDIKPANIYVCRYGREVDFIKVLDFGLVKHGGMPEQGSGLATGGEAVGGTPAFMAPEQALGDAVDGRSDIYAVGCVAYWLLTGTLVFVGQTPLDTIVKHVKEPPEPPSSRAEQDIPPEVEVLVLDCLAKDPGARPPTADELIRRLASLVLAPAWTADMAREWWSAHRPA